jgi:hypothetical protein
MFVLVPLINSRILGMEFFCFLCISKRWPLQEKKYEDVSNMLLTVTMNIARTQPFRLESKQNIPNVVFCCSWGGVWGAVHVNAYRPAQFIVTFRFVKYLHSDTGPDILEYLIRRWTLRVRRLNRPYDYFTRLSLNRISSEKDMLHVTKNFKRQTPKRRNCYEWTVIYV